MTRNAKIKKPETEFSIVPVERIQNKIYLLRNEKVMLDLDLAELYGVPTKRMKQAIKRNIERFPEDFMFELTKEEFENLRSQIVTSSWGGLRYAPLAFTEQGVAMLSSVLRSERAIKVNIAIMRAFAAFRKLLLGLDSLAGKVAEIEKKQDKLTITVFKIIKQLEAPPEEKKKKIGFKE